MDFISGMDQPLVSILIPCYNAAPYLERTLESVLAQTYPRIETIVVNDASTDDSLAIARKFEPRGVRVFNNPRNIGQSATFNVAYKECSGDYISFFDADDLLSPNKIAAQVEVLRREGDEDLMVTCEWARFYDDPREAEFKYQPLWRDLEPRDWLVHAWSNNEMMHGATWLIPRKVLNRSGLWNGELSLINDHEFFCRVMLECRLVRFVPGARTYYRSAVSGNLSGQKSDVAWLSAFKALTLSSDALLAVEDSDRVRHACATKLQRFIYESYPQVPELRAQAAERVKQYGGSDLEPQGGPLFNTARRFVGWKAAKRLQNVAYRQGYLKKKTEQLKAEARAKAGIE